MRPSHTTLRFATAGALVCFLLVTAGCSERWMPSERAVYREACRAIRALPEVPENATFSSIALSRIYVGKSAARADIDVAYSDPSGETVDITYTVTIDRIARSWVATRAEPALPFRG